MLKSKEYGETRFKPEVLSEAFNLLLEAAKKQIKEEIKVTANNLTVRIGSTKWTHDNEEEFFSDYRNSGMDAAYYIKGLNYGKYQLEVFTRNRSTEVSVTCSIRGEVEAVFSVFEKHLPKSRLKPILEKREPPKIFIGHGGNTQWRDLKDHLQDKHQYQIIAYEVGARAGHEIRDVLESMLDESSFAILVMTGEDEAKDGTLHPRANVIHELGLFQGGLGFNKALVLLEEETKDFSNINGVTQIRYPKGRIKETFGEVLATLKREFEIS